MKQVHRGNSTANVGETFKQRKSIVTGGDQGSTPAASVQIYQQSQMRSMLTKQQSYGAAAGASLQDQRLSDVSSTLPNISSTPGAEVPRTRYLGKLLPQSMVRTQESLPTTNSGAVVVHPQ